MSNPTMKPVRIEGATAHRLMEMMTPYRKVRPIKAICLPYPFIVVQNADNAAIRGEVLAEAGSWLALGDNGVLYPISADTFSTTYEAIHDRTD